MDRRVGIAAIRTLAGAALLYGVTELMRPVSASETPTLAFEQTRTVDYTPNFFVALGDKLNLPPKIWQCLSEIGIKWHDRKGVGPIDLTGAAVTLYNSSNPTERVTLVPKSSIPYDPNGYVGYERNVSNVSTGENFALLRGNRVCEAACQTGISLYESTEDGQPMGPVTNVQVDCPSDTKCATNLYWQDEGRRIQVVPPTAAPTEKPSTPPPTMVPTATRSTCPGYVQAPCQ